MTTHPITDYLTSIREHLTVFDLPPAWSVDVTAGTIRHSITVQLAGDEDLPEVAAALLAWADTLTSATAEAWHTHDGHSVHLSLLGKLTDGTSIRVYNAVPAAHYPHADALPPGDKTTLSLAKVREWAALGEAVA